MILRSVISVFQRHCCTKQIKLYSTTSKGWVTAIRRFKGFNFIKINDGLHSESLQVIVNEELMSSDVTYGSCVQVEGEMVQSKGPNQAEELQATKLEVIGTCDREKYPFQFKKRIIPDDIREHPHLRVRTEYMKSILRVRNAALMAIHNYFQSNQYLYIHTPILTSNDCEGGSETFSVQKVKRSEDGTESASHFFGHPVNLTVSGQLHLEAIAGAISRCYTVSPTFRCEPSNTRHHLSEFYMVEAEMAFTTSLEDIIIVMEELVKFITKESLDKVPKDVEYLHKFNATDTKRTSDVLINNKFLRITYDEAVKILQKNKRFSSIEWGIDFSKEQEKYIVKNCGDIPVFVTDFPKALKPFYARKNNSEITVSAVDLLLPDVGELFGGSLREERYDVLRETLAENGLLEALQWYLDIREFGSAPHGGFGMGFDRYLQFLLNIQTVKDTVAFPRTPRHCKL